MQPNHPRSSSCSSLAPSGADIAAGQLFTSQPSTFDALRQLHLFLVRSAAELGQLLSDISRSYHRYRYLPGNCHQRLSLAGSHLRSLLPPIHRRSVRRVSAHQRMRIPALINAANASSNWSTSCFGFREEGQDIIDRHICFLTPKLNQPGYGWVFIFLTILRSRSTILHLSFHLQDQVSINTELPVSCINQSTTVCCPQLGLIRSRLVNSEYTYFASKSIPNFNFLQYNPTIYCVLTGCFSDGILSVALHYIHVICQQGSIRVKVLPCFEIIRLTAKKTSKTPAVLYSSAAGLPQPLLTQISGSPVTNHELRIYTHNFIQ